MSSLGHGIAFPVATSTDVEASGIAFPIIGLILLILRGLMNFSKRIRLGLSELFALFAWLNIVGMGTVLVWSAEKGIFGQPTPTDRPQLTETYISGFVKNSAFSEYIFLILVNVALGTTKLSLLFFLRKIIATGHRNLWVDISTILVAVVSLWTIAFTLTYIFECGGSPDAFWSPLDVRGKQCLPITGGEAVYQKACYISDLVLDVACFLLPFPVILKLQLQLKSKLVITGVFMVGIMTIVASAARLAIWIEVLNTAGDPNEDLNMAITLILQWSMIEAGLAFTASQLPALSPYLSKAARKELGNTIIHTISFVTRTSHGSEYADERIERGHGEPRRSSEFEHERQKAPTLEQSTGKDIYSVDLSTKSDMS